MIFCLLELDSSECLVNRDIFIIYSSIVSTWLSYTVWFLWCYRSRRGNVIAQSSGPPSQKSCLSLPELSFLPTHVNMVSAVRGKKAWPEVLLCLRLPHQRQHGTRLHFHSSSFSLPAPLHTARHGKITLEEINNSFVKEGRKTVQWHCSDEIYSHARKMLGPRSPGLNN